MATASPTRTKAPAQNPAASAQANLTTAEFVRAQAPGLGNPPASPLSEAPSHFGTPSLTAQMNQAARFGHQFGQMVAKSDQDAQSPVQAKGNNMEQQATAANFQPQAGDPGSALPTPIQRKMETAFGTSFGDVRIHQSPQAAAIGAAAYTQGSHIHFAPGQYDPGSLAGQSLLGHELTHVVQQRAGRVATPQGKGAPINADPALEAEADNLGAKAAQGQLVQTGTGLLSGGLVSPSMAAPPVQCGLFSKMGKGLKKVGKGIGGAAKGAFKGLTNFASPLLSQLMGSMGGGMGGMGAGPAGMGGAPMGGLSGMLGGLQAGGGSPVGGMGGLGGLLGGLGGSGLGGMGGGMGGMNSNIMQAIGSGGNLLKDLFN